jgi:purine-nucleoside phosphorylase
MHFDGLAITEFDPAERAVLEPADTVRGGRLPERLLLCFFQDVLDEAVSPHREPIHHLRSEIGPNPVWVDGEGDAAVAILHPGVGAPLAATFLEEAIAAGVRTVVAVGGAGSLHPGLTLGQVIVASAAVRDEGTSFHYLPPARTVEADPELVAAASALLTARAVPHLVASTWTTDAPYRETQGKVERRRAEGCAVVEMETAAFYAVARFRGVRMLQLLYAADDVSGATWDERDWMQASGIRHSLFRLGLDLVRSL